jgi:hypothetical protein
MSIHASHRVGLTLSVDEKSVSIPTISRTREQLFRKKRSTTARATTTNELRLLPDPEPAKLLPYHETWMPTHRTPQHHRPKKAEQLWLDLKIQP